MDVSDGPAPSAILTYGTGVVQAVVEPGRVLSKLLVHLPLQLLLGTTDKVPSHQLGILPSLLQDLLVVSLSSEACTVDSEYSPHRTFQSP